MDSTTAAAGRRTRAISVAARDGVKTVVHDFGGKGPLLLFAHATGLHGWVWKPVIDHLLDKAHCVALDLRGHGDSGVPHGGDVSWDGFGMDALAAARAACGGEVIGVGHSLGGAALLMAELAEPNTFQHLFLYEPAVNPHNCVEHAQLRVSARAEMVRIAKARRATFPSRGEALANYASKPPMAQFQAAALAAYVSHGFSDAVHEGRRRVELKCRPEFEAQIYAGYSDESGTGLSAISCPVTLATGADTDIYQRLTIESLASQLSTAPVVLGGVDHFGPLQQPKQFADAIARHALHQ
jgi:pimeloyl-ACP methyl ester carboxylesterase